MTNLYIVTEHGEEGRSNEHGIFRDLEIAQGVAEAVGSTLERFSSVHLKTMKLDGPKFVPAKPGDEGYANWERERE